MIKQAKVLIIDDEKGIREGISKILDKIYYVDSAENGQLGLEKHAKNNFDLMIVDLNMPVMNGQQFIQNIYENNDHSQTAIIVLTGHGSPEQAYQMLDQYMIADFISKPVRVREQLLFSVKRALEWQRLKNNLESIVEQRTQKLIQSEKMASLGRLVAGVAHEINTPLGSAYTLSSFLADESKKIRTAALNEKLTVERLHEFLKDLTESEQIIVGNLGKASQLVRHFKQLAVEQDSEEKKYFNLVEILRVIEDSFRLKKMGVEFSLNISPAIGLYSCSGAITQVFTHLIQNSLVHGFENTNSQKKIEISAKEWGERIIITYQDNGQGIEEGIIAKIFDPFFTTKFNQGGNGLGMSIVFNLVTEMLGGNIDCKREVQEGVQFILSIPYKKTTL